jgi:hypothetical protein
MTAAVTASQLVTTIPNDMYMNGGGQQNGIDRRSRSDDGRSPHIRHIFAN